MKSLVAAGAASLALLLCVQPAAARDLPDGGLTREDVASWLQGHGLPANIHNDNSGVSIVSSTTAGINFDVYFYDCAGDRCTSIQYAAGWTPLALGTPDNANAWNRDKRYVRAYIDARNNLFGEYDVDVSPGGSWEQMDHSLERWTSQIVDFKARFGGG